MDHADIPPYATRLQHTPKIVTTFPNTQPDHPTPPTTAQRSPLSFQLLLSSTFQFPDAPTTQPPATANTLLSRREALSFHTTTINFKRFVSKSGPVFWFQDRVEEIVMWRRGWKVTSVWMAVYAFLCAHSFLVFMSFNRLYGISFHWQ